MAIFTQNQPSLSSGEVSEELHGRHDLQVFLSSLKTCLNYMTLVKGGVTRTPGSRFIREVLDSSKKSRLLPFQFSKVQNYIIEFGDLKVRFYRDGGVILDGGSPYEVVTPYTEAELPELMYSQSADVLYLTHNDHPTRRLNRFDHDSWTLTEAVFNNGPFLSENSAGGKTLSASAVTGSVTLTAVGWTFDAGHVGALFKLQEKDAGTIAKWVGNKDYSVGDKVRVNGRVYESESGPDISSGPNAPDHIVGTEESGPDTVHWLFLHDEFGIAEVTTVAGGGATATATVVKTLPDSVLSATERWSEGAWSPYRGYPSVVGFYEQRITLAGSPHQPNGLWMGITGDFTDMLAGPDADNAMVYGLVSADGRAHAIHWIMGGDVLAVGAQGREWRISSGAFADPITPDNIIGKEGTSEGSRFVQPVNIDNPIFVSFDGRHIHEFLVEGPSTGKPEAPELSILSDHLLQPGVKEIAWGQVPWRVLWCVLDDGGLIGCTFKKNEQVVGWHRHDLAGGAVESAAVINSSDGKTSELWLIVKRTIEGSTKRYIEQLQVQIKPLQKDVELDDLWYLASAIQYNGSPATVFTGLDHLEGETVSIIADNAVVPDQAVSSGQITLSTAASRVLAGLNMPAEIVSLNPEFLFEGGVTAGSLRRLKSLTVRASGIGGQVGPEGGQMDLLKPSGGGPMGQPPSPYSGVIKTKIVSGFARGTGIVIRQDQPLPLNIFGFIPKFDVSIGEEI